MSAEEDLCCPVCYDIFKDPVVLSCGHSFCKECLEEFWKTKERCECPLCKVLNLNKPECNFVLKSLCEAYLEEYSQRYAAGSKQHCRIHGEKLKLFCLEDKQPVCQICQTSAQHANHECYTIEEAADHFRVSKCSVHATYCIKYNNVCIYLIYLSYVFVNMCIFNRWNSKLN